MPMVKTLKGRISLIYLGLVMMMALIGMIAVWNLYRLGNSINNLMNANYRSIKIIGNMLENIERQDHAILYYIKINHSQAIDSFLEYQNRFLNEFSVERHNITEPGERELVETLEGNYLAFLKSFAKLQEMANDSGPDVTLDFYHHRLQPQLRQIKRNLHDMSALNEKAMFRSKDRATHTAQHSMYFTLVISLLAVCGGFSIALYLINRFFNPINQLTETMKLVKAGELNRQAPVIYQDEIGELAAEFNRMTQRLLQFEQSTVGTLMAEKNRTLTIVRSISDPLIVLDRNFRILLINEAGEAFFAVVEANAVNRHFLEVFREGELFSHISAISESGEESRQKVMALHSREKEFYFNVIVKTVKDNDAAVHSIVVLFQNITQLKEVERVKTNFLATVSHEFKTPLTSMMMGLSLLNEGKIGDLNGSQQKTVAAIQEDSEALLRLVNDLLEVTRMEAGNSLLKFQPCSIVPLIDSIVKRFLEQARQKAVNLYWDVPDELPKVHADPEKITWVLNNLIGNALKYTHAGDDIGVLARVEYDKMCITVKDTGMGIPADYLDKLFDRYMQVKGYDLEVRGTGLGLAIAKEIVEAHGGEIWCESKLDVGSAFTFTLPLYRGENNA
jgi:PAS domain S-box-containing protein